ncbi:MAG: isoleucine--tRNA ligase [Alphaproteobacteria bacterium]|nr:isoleucine--tRNA ligase [Alphaproteobacteria bacterium]
MAYPKTTSQPVFPMIEESIQAFWEKNKIFEKSVEQREGSKPFVFWDGPPGANGEPHYGHISVSAMKDAVCRYQTMRGKQVKRNFGFDCHGLPVEIEVCKKNNLPDRQSILDYGIDKFNAVCEKDVQAYTDVWERLLKRVGRWGDYGNQYYTMDETYMESVIAVVKKLNEKGLLYKDYKTMAYSWGAETPLSNAEAKMEYQERTDKAITVLAELKDTPNTYLVLWTTTPWTLPSNMAVAVGEEIDYVEIEEDGKKYIIGKSLYSKYFKEPTLVREFKGKDLVGKSYHPIFPYYQELENEGAFKVYAGGFVTTTEGTGLVHLAPFGEDDYFVLMENKIPIVCPVNEKAEFISPIMDYAGLNVFDSNEQIIRDLKTAGKLVKQESYVHNYPYCWRTKTPLIYKPIDSWFVNVEKIKEKAIAHNQTVNWIPEHLKDGRFGKWLENARDWSISRNRFWGTPMPVWESENSDFPRTDIFGSIAEIEKVSGMKIKTLHRPEIDSVVYPNPDDPSGKTMMRRVPFVLDCWFDAGSMPYASVHYMFEVGKDVPNFPADFIVEGQDQTRGWFYGLLILGTALFDIPAYKTVMTNGMILDENKKKMSKSLKNYPDPDKLFSTVGADSFRWFILGSPLFKAESVSIDLHGEVIRKASREALIPLWNAYHFFTLYANADGIQAKEITESSAILDRYILAKMHQLEVEVVEALDLYSFDKATTFISEFLEILNNWYIRRSRDRFWGTDVSKEDEQSAFDTLYTVLVHLSKLMAPMTPMISEYIYQNLTGGESVHLVDLNLKELLEDSEIQMIQEMDTVRAMCSAGKAVRETYRLRNRLPLASTTLVHLNAESLKPYLSLIADELNVKNVVFASNLNDFAKQSLYILTPVVGARLGSALKDIVPASKKGNYEIKNGKLHIAGHILNEDEFENRLEVKEGLAGQALSDNTGVIVLDTEISDDLYVEGLARDFIRLIQDERKKQEFDISDRVNLVVESADEKLVSALKTWQDDIQKQVLADSLSFKEATNSAKIEDFELKFDVTKA